MFQVTTITYDHLRRYSGHLILEVLRFTSPSIYCIDVRKIVLREMGPFMYYASIKVNRYIYLIYSILVIVTIVYVFSLQVSPIIGLQVHRINNPMV